MLEVFRSALGVGQLEVPPSQVFFEHTVLFPQILDDVELVAIHPTRERHEENPQPDNVNHAPSVLGWPPPHPWDCSAEFSDSTGAAEPTLGVEPSRRSPFIGKSKIT